MRDEVHGSDSGSGRGGGRRERGAASLEYIATITVAAVLIGAVSAAAAASAPGIGDGVRYALCKMLSFGQGECTPPPSADAHVPTEPCVVSSTSESLTFTGAVVFVRGADGHTYEKARLSDGTWRVTRLEDDSLGAETGVGYGGTVVINDRTYGGSAQADVGADLGIRAGQVWYVDSEASADRIVDEVKEDTAEDLALGDGPVRWLWEQGQDLYGAVTGNGDGELPPPDDTIVQGGVTLDASAEAYALLGGAQASVGEAAALGARTSRDGTTTVYLRTAIEGGIEGSNLTIGPGEVSNDGAKLAGKAQVLTAVTLDANGNVVSVSGTMVASGESAGLAAWLFTDSDSSNLSDNQAAGTLIYQATLPVSSDADRLIAARYLASVGVANMGVPGLLLQTSTGFDPYRSLLDFFLATRDHGVMTRQTYSDSSTSFGGNLDAKAGIEFGVGGGYSSSDRTSTGAEYWDGHDWVAWEGCAP